MSKLEIVQTAVVFRDRWLATLKRLDAEGKPAPLATVNLQEDPITKRKSVVVYTDDGRGNGLPIFEFDIE